MFHYQISFVTSPDTVSNEGSVHIQLIGELRDSNEIQVSRTMGTDFEPSSRYSSLYTSRKPLGKVQMARVTFHPNGFGRLLYLLMNRPFNVVTLHVRFMSHPDAKLV